jgi:hypothetical protein
LPRLQETGFMPAMRGAKRPRPAARPVSAIVPGAITPKFEPYLSIG